MSQLAFAIRFHRVRLGLTREALAKHIHRSASFIAALERRQPAGDEIKSPSLDTLNRLIDVLATVEGKPNEKITRIAAQLAFAAVGLESSVFDDLGSQSVPDELENQASVLQQSQIWVLSDILAEGEDHAWAERVVQNIADRGVQYTYFVPFGRQTNWATAIQNIKYALGKNNVEADEHVTAYRLSDVAFTCRARITNPYSANPTGVYSVLVPSGNSVAAARSYEFPPMPPEVVLGTVRTIKNLISLEDGHRRQSDQSSSVAADPALGSIEHIYPPRPSGGQ